MHLDINPRDKPLRYLGVGIAEKETAETPFYFAKEKFANKINLLRKFSPQATCVLLNTVVYPTLNHVHAVAPMPESLQKCVRKLTSMALYSF